jgi:hypothetical protein
MSSRVGGLVGADFFYAREGTNDMVSGEKAQMKWWHFISITEDTEKLR